MQPQQISSWIALTVVPWRMDCTWERAPAEVIFGHVYPCLFRMLTSAPASSSLIAVVRWPSRDALTNPHCCSSLSSSSVVPDAILVVQYCVLVVVSVGGLPPRFPPPKPTSASSMVVKDEACASGDPGALRIGDRIASTNQQAQISRCGWAQGAARVLPQGRVLPPGRGMHVGWHRADGSKRGHRSVTSFHGRNVR